jgi:hypothetical protein
MKSEAPVWEADSQISAFDTPGKEITVYYLFREWPDGGKENAIMVRKNMKRSQRWVRMGSNNRGYERLLIR